MGESDLDAVRRIVQKERAMIERTNNDVEVVYYYYDSHPTEEDLMGESRPHRVLVAYLRQVLEWLFRHQACEIYENFNFFQTTDEHEYPLACGSAWPGSAGGLRDCLGENLGAGPGGETSSVRRDGSARILCL